MKPRTLRSCARGRSLVASLALLTGLVVPRVARADDFQYDGANYSFQITGVPDLDQKRAFSRNGTVFGLPNDGKMYCGPTSALNWMAYIANHGYPAVSPGPGNWETGSLAAYNTITFNLLFMGAFIGTDPIKGGGMGDEAVESWLGAVAPGQFIVALVVASGDWSPRVRDAAMAAFSGGLVNIAMGWYTNADEPEAHMRVGGHVVTLVGGGDDGVGPNFVFISDPARGGDSSGMDSSFFTQSPFGPNGSQFHPETEYFCGQDANGFPSGCVIRTQDRLVNFGSGYMDAYMAIFPKYGLSYDLDQLVLFSPIQLTGRSAPRPVRTFATATGARVVDAVLHPIGISHPYLAEGSDVVWQLDALTGTSSPLARVSSTPLRLAYRPRDGSLYVLMRDRIQSLDRSGRPGADAALEAPLDAIAFDESNQMLVGVSRQARRVYSFDAALRVRERFDVPQGVLGEQGRLTLRIHPSTGEMWTLVEGARFLTRMLRGRHDPARLELRAVSLPPEVTRAQGLDVDEKGTLFVTSEGRVHPLDRFGRLLRTSPFFGVPGGPGVQIARSFSNFDPALHTGPAWINVLPEDAVPAGHR